MIEKYNNIITKLFKLFVMMFGTYITLINMSDLNITNNNLLQLILTVGILFLILDKYYPSVELISDNNKY